MNPVESSPPLPNLIIAGAPKCGTTSLFDYLVQHPQVGGSSVKETCYFMDRDYSLFKAESNYLDHGLSGYRRYFSHLAPGCFKWICEATPDYLYQQSALEHIADLPGDVTILFMLRHPADRAYSLFNFAQNNVSVVDKKVDFCSLLDDIERNNEDYSGRPILRNIINHGFYYNYLHRWKARYGERVRIHLFEEMSANPRIFMQQLARSLDIDPGYYERAVLEQENRTVRVRNQRMQRIYKALRSFEWLREMPQIKTISRLYKKLNFDDAVREKSVEDRQRLHALSVRYQEDMTMIEREFGIDLAVWKGKYR